ncbi:hypothetical protein M8J76_013110 [Diaphorina citri]|nr:hypothetical protein M8J76_013110 [Diaphorina citri]
MLDSVFSEITQIRFPIMMKPAALLVISCLLCLLHTALAASAYLPSMIDRLEAENLLDRLETENQYHSCPECEPRFNPDHAKRVKMMSVWARNGMPLSILYLNSKPNTGPQREDVYPMNVAPVLLPYRSNPSTRSFNSKIYQAASLGKPKPILSSAQAKQLQQTGSGIPMRRQSVVLPQLFVTYGFDNKKPNLMERE